MTTAPNAPNPGARLFTRKPTTIRAICWTGYNTGDIWALVNREPVPGITLPAGWYTVQGKGPEDLAVPTPNGICYASPGDWVIAGTTPGDFYPCKADTFWQTYEAAPAVDLSTPPHVQRMRKEFEELDERLRKLFAFTLTETFSGLPEPEQVDLRLQLAAMMAYRHSLSRRLQRADGVEPVGPASRTIPDMGLEL